MTEAELSQILYAAGLAEIADKRVTDGEIPLSGGEKQRISLARALSRRAPLTILDEPSNHLDAAGREWPVSYTHLSAVRLLAKFLTDLKGGDLL